VRERRGQDGGNDPDRAPDHGTW